MQMGVLRLENAHQRFEAITDCGCARRGPAPSDNPNGTTTLSDPKIGLNANFYVSPLAANTEKT